MAHGNKYTCATCGAEYEYCPKCVVVKPKYEAERYCSKAHADIFTILSKHGCNLTTAEDTLEALKDYNITGLTEGIQAHIDSLQPKIEAVEKEMEVETTLKKKLFRTQE